MKVTSRHTYGIMAALDLALNYGAGPVQARSIAQRQGIPGRFLEQVLQSMKKAGLVASQRGAQGGYLLARAPEDLSVADIVEALDGPRQYVNGHQHPNGRRNSDSTPVALLGQVWERVREAEFGVLSEVTIGALVERHRTLERQHTLMYHI